MNGVSVAAVRLRIPFRNPFVTSAGTWRAHDAWIVRLRHDDGREGYGEACLGPGASAADRERLALSMRDAVDAAAADGSHADPIALAVRSAFSGARLDLDGPERELGQDTTGDVAVNATIATEEPEATAAAVRQAIAAGVGCLKLKVGGEASTAALAERVGTVRDAVGPEVDIRLDANGAWDGRTARERIAAVAACGVEYVEQPIPPGATADLAALRRAVAPVPIAADEAVSTLDAASALLAADAVDVLVVKPSRVGGPSTAMEIARMAADAGVGVTISTLLETGVGLAAAVRVAAALPDPEHAHGLATADLLVDDVLATTWAATGGVLRVPPPGLRLDEAVIERWAIERVGWIA